MRRPSTYSGFQSLRGYTEKRDIEGEKRKIDVLTMITDGSIKETNKEIKTGERTNSFQQQGRKVVNDYLNREFPILLDYDFTKSAGEFVDRISKVWHKIVKTLLYNIFRERIDLLGRDKTVDGNMNTKGNEDYPEGVYIYIAEVRTGLFNDNRGLT